MSNIPEFWVRIGKENVLLVGQEQLDWITKRFNHTREEAIQVMKQNNQDMSFLSDEPSPHRFSISTFPPCTGKKQ
jgi:adenine specific DNA methylase Mod